MYHNYKIILNKFTVSGGVRYVTISNGKAC
jgi:hypothetical protein